MPPSKKIQPAGLIVLFLMLFSRVGGAEPVPSTVPAVPSQAAVVSPLLENQDSDALRVEVQNVEGDVSAAEGSVLRSGDTLKTGNGSCGLLIDGKTKVLVTPNTTLKITEALRNPQTKAESTHLALQSGNLKVVLPKLKEGSSFVVTTPTAVATVRGTILYIQTGNLQGQDSTTLYVDESTKGVDFKNLFSGNSINVPAFALSNALANGQLDKPVELTEEQKEAFFEAWKQIFGAAGVSQQFGVEEILLPGANLPDAESFAEFNDALLDQLAEQNLFGSNGLPLPTVLPGPGASKEPGEEPTEEELLEAQERAMIRAEIADLLGDQDFDNADANLARVSDAQTGKVFTDVHGNRVRVDQYIYETELNLAPPEGDPISFSQIGILALTARTGAYQNGVSSAQFIVNFNRIIGEADGPLRDLPWDDYLRVVEDDQLTGTDLLFPYGQFIVHESAGANEPDLFPLSFGAVLTHPPQEPGPGVSNGLIAFAEAYAPPELAVSDQGTFWVQGRTYESTSIIQLNGDAITSFSTVLINDGQSAAILNNDPVSLESRDLPQTTGLPSDPGLANLMTGAGIANYLDSDVHPAFFEEIYNGDRMLVGMFLPIDDAGAVINAPGFTLRGLRDAINPNPLVNGGDYNLELLFSFGTLDDGAFNEVFRVDLLIDNDLFNGGQGSASGIRNPYNALNTSAVFPSLLETDQDI